MSVAKHYKGHVSGWMLAITAIGLQIAAGIVANDPTLSAKVVKWSAWLTTGAAIWAIFVAQYDAWREQNDARKKAEAELNSEAHLTGTVDVHFTDNPSGIGFRFHTVNDGRKMCQVDRIVFIAKLKSGGTVDRDITLWEPSAKTVEHGIRFNESGTLMIPNQEVSRSDLANADIKMYLIDSLRKEHHDIETVKRFPAYSTEGT